MLELLCISLKVVVNNKQVLIDKPKYYRFKSCKNLIV